MLSTLNWLMESSDGLQHSVLLILIRTTLILTVAWLCHFACSRRNPRLRILLWRTTAIAIIGVFCLSLIPYRLKLALLPAVSHSTELHETNHANDKRKRVPAADIPVRLNQSRFEAGEMSDLPTTPVDSSSAMVKPGKGDRNVSMGSQQSAARPATSHSFSLFGYFVTVWAIGMALNSLGWLGGMLRLISLYRRASMVPTYIQNQALEIATTLDYSGPIDVRYSDDIQTPFIVGAWKPRVLIPAHQCAETERQELQASLAHELAHCQGKDLRWNHLLTLLQILLWFYPLAWKIRVVHADACDELCDAKAAGYLGDDKLYGRLLATLALRVADQNRMAALAMAGRSQVRKRIEAVGRNMTSKVLNRWQTGSFITCATVAVIFLGTVSISRSQDQTSTSQTQPPVVKPLLVEEILSGTGEPGSTARLFYYSDSNTRPVFIHETTIDTNGRFSFKEVPIVGKKGRLVLAATKPGFASVIRYLRQESDRSDISLKMKSKTAALSGTITDANGTPIPNAVVSTQADKYPIPGAHMAITDKSGQYNISDLAAWNAEETKTYDPKTKTGTMVTKCFFRVNHADYPITLGAYSQIPQKVDLTLLPPAIVEGQVVDLVTGEPLANAGVAAQGVARRGWFTTKTDADGNYQLRMTNDHYNIWAIAPDRMPLAIKALKVTQGQRLTGMDIRMTRGGYVVGKVIDPATNQPVDGSQTKIQVGHHGPARPMTGAAVTSTPVKTDGTYRLHVAAGRNYVYLMSGNAAPVYLKVGDAQTVKHDFTIGTISKISIGADPDQLLRRKIMKETRREEEKQVTRQKSKPEAATLRQNTSVGQLLTELDDMNTGSERFSDKWANQIRRIVALGPDVVPQLVAELDRTSNSMMLRCLGFMLRAIGDKRAVPGLIRAIPKTLIRPGSDMGLRIDGTDQTLLKFMQQHDLSPKHNGNEYDCGRPVREIFGALHSLTGQNFGEQELFSVFLNKNDFPSQKHAKAVLFQRIAERWAQWWQLEGHKLTNDPSFHTVKLSPLPVLAPSDSISADAQLKTESGTSNWILEPMRRASSRRSFYDLDTGRAARLPKRWRDKKLSEEQLLEIQEWAAEQGYDMLGDEIEGENEKSLFVLRPIGLSTWELPKTQWKAKLKQTSINSLKEQGRLNKQDLLVSFDAETNKAKPLETATFFYITREGTPGILYVGIEVHDNSLKPGGISTGDNELNPVAFMKGRRFGLSRLVERFPLSRESNIR